MRRLALASTMLLAACATAPRQSASTPSPVVTAPIADGTGLLIGVSAAALVGHFGNPALQVREGNSLKLQFRTRRCVLDAYLYPQANSATAWRVTHIDTRDPSGADIDQAACISEFEEPS